MTKEAQGSGVIPIQQISKMCSSPEYRAWGSMIQRCTNPKAMFYDNYGGRGIRVCQRWLGSFNNFLKDMGVRLPGTSLDRINNDGSYNPSNCRWANRKVQTNNRRNSVRIKYGRDKVTLLELSKLTGINYSTLRFRRKSGWSDQELCLTADKNKREYGKKTIIKEPSL